MIDYEKLLRDVWKEGMENLFDIQTEKGRGLSQYWPSKDDAEKAWLKSKSKKIADELGIGGII